MTAVTDDIINEWSIPKLLIIFLHILRRYCGEYSNLDRTVFRFWFLHSEGGKHLCPLASQGSTSSSS